MLFTDAAHGWLLCGDTGAGGRFVNLHTADGGKTWREQPAPFSGDKTLYDFPDPVNGWAVMQLERGDSFYVAISHTTDGGNHWQRVSLPWNGSPGDPAQDWATYLGLLGGLDFSRGGNGWIVGSEQVVADGFETTQHGIVWHTSDGGGSWAGSPLGQDEYATDVVATGPDSAIVVGYRQRATLIVGFIISTSNGGRTWSRQDVGERLLDIAFSDLRTGWIWGRDQAGTLLLRSTDGGLTWAKLLHSQGALGVPVFVDHRHGTFERVVEDQLPWRKVSMLTTDGGETWSEGEIAGLLPEELTEPSGPFWYAVVNPALRWAFSYTADWQLGLWRWTPTGAPLSPVLVD
jgi:photosystem II stability/assembly factor-like uncharacterized protein